MTADNMTAEEYLSKVEGMIPAVVDREEQLRMWEHYNIIKTDINLLNDLYYEVPPHVAHRRI